MAALVALRQIRCVDLEIKLALAKARVLVRS
jgi:hypothetical protein